MHPISRYSRFIVASLSMPASYSACQYRCQWKRQSMFISLSDGRWTVAHWPCVRLPLHHQLSLAGNPTISSASGTSTASD